MRPGRMLSWNGESRQQTAGEAERCCAVLCCAVLCCAVLCCARKAGGGAEGERFRRDTASRLSRCVASIWCVALVSACTNPPRSHLNAMVLPFAISRRLSERAHASTTHAWRPSGAGTHTHCTHAHA